MKEIVIKIDDELHETIIDPNKWLTPKRVNKLVDAVLHGTELPKGHGRLIDADQLKSLSYEVFVDDGNPNRADGLSSCNGLAEDDIDLAETLVEADEQ